MELVLRLLGVFENSPKAAQTFLDSELSSALANAVVSFLKMPELD
jgi:hypothetical protein